MVKMWIMVLKLDFNNVCLFVFLIFTNCLTWKKLDFTTALIWPSGLKPLSILKQKFVTVGYPYCAIG